MLSGQTFHTNQVFDNECDTAPKVVDDSWLKDLGLQMADQIILQNGHWVNDRIVHAVFKLLPLHPSTWNLAGHDTSGEIRVQQHR